MQVHSPQIAEHRDMPVQAQTFIVGKGPAVPAGGTLAITFSGLPHQPVWPRNVALGLAIDDPRWRRVGQRRVRAGRRPEKRDRRRRLDARRDRLFAELAGDRGAAPRAARSTPDRYATRRRELVAALEQLYAQIDDEAAA